MPHGICRNFQRFNDGKARPHERRKHARKSLNTDAMRHPSNNGKLAEKSRDNFLKRKIAVEEHHKSDDAKRNPSQNRHEVVAKESSNREHNAGESRRIKSASAKYRGEP